METIPTMLSPGDGTTISPTTQPVDTGPNPPHPSSRSTSAMLVTPTLPTPPRHTVGFAQSNTVLEASDGVDADVVIWKQLAPVFSATAKRKTTLFLKVRLPIESKPKDPTAAAHLKLKELGELMINQDPTILIYKYQKTCNDERDACS
jgi:hypothetical protein